MNPGESGYLLSVMISEFERQKAIEKRLGTRFVAYRCGACGKDIDVNVNPCPKRFCAYCGCGRWRKMTALTLREAFLLYADTGVVFVNEDKPEHMEVGSWLRARPRAERWLDRKQRLGCLKKWPYSW